jgi:hypothetical protein
MSKVRCIDLNYLHHGLHSSDLRDELVNLIALLLRLTFGDLARQREIPVDPREVFLEIELGKQCERLFQGDGRLQEQAELLRLVQVRATHDLLDEKIQQMRSLPSQLIVLFVL